MTIQNEYEDKVRRGTAATDLPPVDPGHSDRDPSSGPNGGGSVDAVHEATYTLESLAQRGQLEATKGYQAPGPFTPSNGMHSVGQDHIGCFSDAVNRSGGVRQGSTFVSYPADGVARADVVENTGLHGVVVQSQGSGVTFEERQHRRWSGYGG
jgi:hypothetical protein